MSEPLQEPCTACKGAGEIDYVEVGGPIHVPCSACGGKGYVEGAPPPAATCTLCESLRSEVDRLTKRLALANDVIEAAWKMSGPDDEPRSAKLTNIIRATAQALGQPEVAAFLGALATYDAGSEPGGAA